MQGATSSGWLRTGVALSAPTNPNGVSTMSRRIIGRWRDYSSSELAPVLRPERIETIDTDEILLARPEIKGSWQWLDLKQRHMRVEANRHIRFGKPHVGEQRPKPAVGLDDSFKQIVMSLLRNVCRRPQQQAPFRKRSRQQPGPHLYDTGLRKRTQEWRWKTSRFLRRECVEAGRKIRELRTLQQQPGLFAIARPVHARAVPHQGEGDRREDIPAERRGGSDGLAISERAGRQQTPGRTVGRLRRQAGIDHAVKRHERLADDLCGKITASGIIGHLRSQGSSKKDFDAASVQRSEKRRATSRAVTPPYRELLLPEQRAHSAEADLADLSRAEDRTHAAKTDLADIGCRTEYGTHPTEAHFADVRGRAEHRAHAAETDFAGVRHVLNNAHLISFLVRYVGSIPAPTLRTTASPTELAKMAWQVAYCPPAFNSHAKVSMALARLQRRAAGMATLILVSAMTAATVSTIYWPQALLVQMRTDFGEPTLVALLPGAILLGYAAGVTALAVASHNLADRNGLAWHAVILVTGIVALTAAPTAMAAVLACMLMGAGCSLTQRLLIIATNTYRPERRAEVIGLLIASGLSGIVVARAWIGDIAQRIGWRHTLVVDAVLIAILIAALFTTKWPELTEPAARPISLPRLWSRYATLRHAALHQAVIFAAFNAGWAVLPILITTTPTTRAVVAGVGALTAIVAGQTARRLRPARLAAIAPLFIAIAAAMTAFVATRLAYVGAMVFIEIGTQLALVANQTRAQAIAPDVGSRGRMASLVTAVGFAGGALGAATANMFSR